MKRIITVQHTQSAHHTNGMVGSWTDWELTDLGKRQAEAIGKALKAEIAGKDVILYASDLKRAEETAKIIGEQIGAVPILKTELRERNLGKCCGHSIEWLRENLECPEQTVDDRLFSDAESRRDEWNRLKPFFDELMANGYETVIVVSHGDLLSAFLAMFLALPVESLVSGEFAGKAGGVSELTMDDTGNRSILRFCDLSYIARMEGEA